MTFSRLGVSFALASAMTVLAPVPAQADFWEVTGERFSHDPSLIQEGSTWYEFFTGQGIQVRRSDNGTHWTVVPQIFLNPPAWLLSDNYTSPATTITPPHPE